MRVLRGLASVVLALALIWALTAFGATERDNLNQFLILLGAATVVTLWAYRAQALVKLRFLPLLVVGVFCLLQILRLPPLQQQGYVHLGIACCALVVGLLLGREEKTGRRIFLFLVALGCFEAFYGLVQSIGAVDYIGDYYRGHGRLASGTFINRNNFAGLLNITISLAIGALYATYPRKANRLRSEGYAWAWIILLGTGFMGLAVLLSLSRGGTLSLVAGLVFLSVLLAAGRRRGSRSVSSWAGTVLLVTVVGLGLWVGIDALLVRFAEENAGADRIAVYRSTLKMIADYPLGVGPGMYQWYFRPYQPAGPMCWFNHAHNDYLQTAGEWGPLVALGFWGFVVWRMIGAVRTFLRGGDLWRQGIALGSAGAIFCILLHSLVEFNLQIPVIAAIFCLILAISWANEERTQATDSTNGTDKGRFWGVGLKLALTVLVGLAGWAAFKQVVALRIAQLDAPVLQKYQEALRWSPHEPAFHLQLGIFHRDDAEHFDAPAATRHLEKAVALNPYNGDYWRELSRAHEMEGNADKAEKAIRRALSLTPLQAADLWRLGNFFLRQDRTPEALEHIRQAVAMDHRYQEPATLLLWKARLLHENLPTLGPARPATILPLIRFLIAKEAPVATIASQWDKMMASGEAPEIPASRFFLDYLLKQGLHEKAREQWVLLNQKAGIVDDEYRQRKELTWNCGFELPMQASPLDWRVPTGDGYRAHVVEGEGIDRSKALRIDFEGTHNLSFGIHQLVVVEPGRKYRFSAKIRSENISTDQGLWFRVTDMASSNLLQTKPVLGTSPWTRVEGELEVKQGTERIFISLLRTPSRKLDNKLAGTVWVDEVRVTPLAESAGK